jgi:MFS family permease
MFSSFRRLLAAAFLVGLGTSQLALLAVVWQSHQMSAATIANISTLYVVAVLIGAFLSGPLTQRIGPGWGLVLGGAITTAGVASLAFTLDSVPLTLLGSLVRGLGYGFLQPSGQMVAQDQVAANDRIRAVGMFSAMLLVPTVIGPAFAEWSLSSSGELAFFGCAVVPMALGVVMTLTLPHHHEATAQPTGYLAMLRDRRLWRPSFSVMQSGLCWGFAITFIAVMLFGNTSVGAFFIPFSIVLLAVRFVAMKYLQRLAPSWLVTFGLAAYLSGLVLLSATIAPSAVGIAGCFFGFGYAVTLPSCVEWSTRLYPGSKQPVALMNTVFQLGYIIAAQIVGLAVSTIAWSGVLLVMAGLVLLAVVMLGGEWRKSILDHQRRAANASPEFVPKIDTAPGGL